MNRSSFALALSLLAGSSIALAQKPARGFPSEAKKGLDYAIGSWSSRTQSIGRDGQVRRTSYSDTVRKYVIDDRVVEIAGVSRADGSLFRAWEYDDAKAGRYCLTSISGSGQLMTMKGDLGDPFRWTSEDRKRSDGTTMRMRFTHSDFKPNSFTAVGEYSTDSGKTWTVFNRHYLTRKPAPKDPGKESRVFDLNAAEGGGAREKTARA